MEEDVLALDGTQVNEVLQFAQGLYNGFGGYGFYANPFTTHNNLISLNNSPRVPTYEKLLEALGRSPMDYSTICGYSEFMEVFDTIYGKTLRYLAGLLSYDIHYYPTRHDLTKSEIQSKEFQDDLKRVEKFLSNFNYKQEFSKIVQEVLRKETSYIWFRDTHDINTPIELDDDEYKTKKNEKFSLQIMPQNYCILTGYFNSSQLLYDFDMNYFLQGTVDINLFDPSFKKKYREVFGDGEQSYVPSSQLNRRHGEFATYIQCSPNDGAYAFKMDISNFRQVPPFASLMKSALDNTTIEKLQKDKNMASAYALLMGEIKTFDGAKTGEKPNQFTITPERVGQFLQMVQSGLQTNVRPVALPLEETRLAQFNDTNPLMANYQIRTSASQGASASSMVYTDTKMAQFEMQQAIETDFAFMEKLYLQFAEFMNFYVNKKLKKYKFGFSFDGLNRSFYRTETLKQLVQMADKGMVLDESHWASVRQMKPQDFRKSLIMANSSDFTNYLTPLLNLNTMKDGASQEVGNQVKDSSEITDNGAEARNYE